MLLDQISTRLDRPTPYRSPWATLFSFGGDAADAGYFLSDDKSLLFILVESPKGDKGSFVGDQQAIDAVRGAIARLREAFPMVQAGVTGDARALQRRDVGRLPRTARSPRCSRSR